MAEDDPFADLGETLEEEPEDASGEATDQAPDPNTAESTADDAGSGTESGSGAATDAESRDPVADPAFSYEAAQQRPFYAREATVEEFDSWLNYELERALSELGYRNIVVREMTDALLRTVVEEDLVDDVAERFERAREADATD